MSKVPKISVIMSLYNSEKYLHEAIDSVLAQTFSDFEFIIIDDGSSDNSATIAQTYNDTRIRFFRQDNAGLPAALNVAVNQARSALIARMDSDDVCLPERLQKQYDYLQCHPDAVVVGAAAMCIDAQGEKLGIIQMSAYHAKGALVLPESPCVHPTVMFRRSACEQVGFYAEGMRYGGEDAVLFNKMLASEGGVANLGDVLLLYRVTPLSMSQKSKYFNKLLRQRVIKEVRHQDVSEANKEALVQAYAMPRGGNFGYHLYVGKLLLKGDQQHNKARMHFKSALKENVFSLHAWLGWLESFFPKSWLKSLR